MSNKYKDYFDIDADYFPQINDSSIKAASRDFWKQTYPHETFIEMLTKLDRILARKEKRSLWIEGAYGTGKSQCAYALKKILDVEESELIDYWNRYDALKSKKDLLQKLNGHKSQGIITAYRYASGGIDSPRKLFMAIQDSVKATLIENNLYTGENTLRENILSWLSDPLNKEYFNNLLQKEEWRSLFTQTTVEEVIYALRNNKEIKSLVDNIFQLSDREGITAMSIDADSLQKWLKDVIKENGKKIVFIWDEFSDYFKNNKNTLSEFQKIVELVNEFPFYFIIVTHESGQLFSLNDETGKKVQDRFLFVEIFLPDNIAFNLIGHAFSVKQEAEATWTDLTTVLYNRLPESKAKVMNAAGVTEKAIKDILPLHPMTAFALKNIATAFKSNQRSMFDFIKSEYDNEVEAFQWFIENRGPLDDHPLLTIDLLWDFFYEKGRQHLNTEIRLILDTYKQQQSLNNNEKVVFKVILIMQAIDQRLRGEIELFKASDQNLSYAFEGITTGLDVNAKNIAKALVAKGILIENPLKSGNVYYKVAILAGDQDKIEDHKKEILQQSSTTKLVTDGNLSSVLILSAPLRLRLEAEKDTGKLTFITSTDFDRKISGLSNIQASWKFIAVIAFAKDEDEAVKLRGLIKSAVSEKRYKNIIFIDALSSPLGYELFDQYVNYSAMSMYYAGNDNKESLENQQKAKQVLEQEWKNKVHSGQFTVYTYKNQEGESVGNGQGVSSLLQTIIVNKFPLIFDFRHNLTENHLKLTSAKASAECGIIKHTSGVVRGIEKIVLPQEWDIDRYWESPIASTSNISKIKIKIEKLIKDSFDREGRISIGDIYTFIETEYGFAPCNLSAFLTGFILKEYSGDPYRYKDSLGSHETMTSGKLAEMIGNYIGKSPSPTYIVKMTAEERAFYEFSENIWKITPNTCSSIVQMTKIISQKLKSFKLPVWSLEDVDNNGVFYLIEKYIMLVQSEGTEANNLMLEIGKIALQKPNIIETLHDMLSIENCQKGMLKFLKSFEDGKILSLAKEINAENKVLSDIRELFEVKHSCLWERETGEDEIKKLLDYYGVIKISNSLLNAEVNSLDKTYEKWIGALKFIRISYESIISKFPKLMNIINTLLTIYQRKDILFEQIKDFKSDLESNISIMRKIIENHLMIFTEIYKPYLDNLEETEIRNIYSNLPNSMFEQSAIESNIKVKEAVQTFRQSQQKTIMYKIWKDKTNSKNPKNWSVLNRMPILSCVDKNEFEEAKRVFEILNSGLAKEEEIVNAIEFLQITNLFETLSDHSKLMEVFNRDIIGEYQPLLANVEYVREALEQLNIEPYDWRDSPIVKLKIKEMAEAEYHSGGSDIALSKIDNMDGPMLKDYLKLLVKDNMRVGIEIIANRGN